MESHTAHPLFLSRVAWPLQKKKNTNTKRLICLQYGFISSMGLCDALNIWGREDVKVETPFQTH